MKATTFDNTKTEPVPTSVDKSKRVPLYDDEPQTIAEIFLQAAEKHNRPDALNYKKGDNWSPISSQEMIERVRAIALGIYSLGINRKDRVAILSANCPEWTLTDAGCQFAGAIDVPIYNTQAAPQVAYILKDSGARLFFLENKVAYERIREDVKGLASVERLIFFDITGVTEEKAMSLEQVEELGRALGKEEPNLADELIQASRSEDIATIIYTSGTTGEPKGVMLSQSNVVSNVLDAGSGFKFSNDDTALSILPLSHIYERGAMYMYIFHGMSVFYAESIEKLGQNLREVRPTLFVAVPRLFEKVYAKAKEKAASSGKVKNAIFDWSMNIAKEYARKQQKKAPISFDLKLKHKIADKLVFAKWREGVGGRIRLFISGGAALSEEIGYIFLGAGLTIAQGYGLTETSPVITSNPIEDNRIGTVGKAVRNVEVRIAEDGEIEARGPNVMQGYYNKPEATRDVFTSDGWFKTGDIGVLDEEGYLKITDRKKELFKTSGGKYVAPAPIEQLIKASRFVNQVVLIGNERKFPAALIVPNFDQLQSYAKLKNINVKSKQELCCHPRIIDLMQRQIDAATPDLAKYEKVKCVALLENELSVEGGELTPTLKVKRRIVDEKYKQIIDKMYKEAEASYNKEA